ncbi:MAG: hypothetical protein JRN13_03120 [Nitrososphaerota archaeon]|jgi:hypothetical protein|nr:hypothetical protein [Nitrososphaerota archaeon]MDG6937072.1 hypothetical protein [Nitrososphaerota archaeon]MDG6972313.1 hypothetical protein [Nitrososphaerota archaeon]MDG6986950.1 hypothetical protein [Nitrososphaerota archaeon]MDG7017873.1 hypothetical protein [Nitrososphaerota archaeon]
MIGVTLSLGSMVVAAATSQFGLASGSASVGASLRESSAGTQVALVYSTVSPSSACPAYQGIQEGPNLTLALYDYGSAAFTPAGFVVNSTLISGGFPPLDPGSLVAFHITLGGCAHPSGQTVVAFDAAGGEVQVET